MTPEQAKVLEAADEERFMLMQQAHRQYAENLEAENRRYASEREHIESVYRLRTDGLGL